MSFSGNPSKGKRVFCNLCGTRMHQAKVKKDQIGIDIATKQPLIENGNYVYVTRVFYWCPKDDCHTVQWFDYRQDGKRGQLSVLLEMEKKLDLRPEGLGGKFGEIV